MAYMPDPSLNQTTPVAPPSTNATASTAPPAAPDVAATTAPPVAPTTPMPVAAPQTAPPPPPKKSFGQGLVEGMNGKTYQVDGQGNVISAATTAPSKSGTAGNILGSVLEGALRGLAAPTSGSGRGGAFSAGAAASQRGAIEQDQRARAAAQLQFQNQQQALKDRVEVNKELAITSSIAQNMKFEAEDHPGKQRFQELENEGLVIAHQGAMDRLNKDAFEFADELLQHGAPPMLFTQHGPELDAQIPGAVAGNSVVATNGIQGKGSGVNIWHTADLTQPLTGKPIIINKYDKGTDQNGVPIPNPTIFTPDGKTSLKDVADAYFDGRRALYQMLQQHNDTATAQDQKAKLAETQAGTKQKLGEAAKDYAEANKANKEAVQIGQLNPQGAEGLTGTGYLQTLPEGPRGVVQAIGEGRATYSDRQLFDKNGNPSPTMQAVMRAYPDFNVSNAKTWGHTQNEYMGSGATAKKVVSYNVSMEHMKALFDSTTTAGMFNPASKDYQDRQAELQFVSEEVGNAVKNGVMAQSEGEKIKNGVSGGLTAGLNRERIQKTAGLLHDKLDEYQTKFQAGAPSSAVKVPSLMSVKGADAYDYVRSGGQVQNPQANPAQVVLPTAQNTVRTGVFNGKNVYQLNDGSTVDAQGNKVQVQ